MKQRILVKILFVAGVVMSTLLALTALMVVVLPLSRVSLASGNQRAANALNILTLESGVFLCDGENHFVEAPGPMRVRKVYVGFGQDMGGRSDLLGVVTKHTRSGDEHYIAKGGWDHYAEPTGVSNQALWFDFAPDWIQIGREESVRLYYQCHGFSQPTPHAKVLAVIYYLK